MIYIRVDANEIIATGHVMRCKTIAHMLQRQGEEVEFLLADDNAVPLLVGEGIRYRILNTNWKKPESQGEIEVIRTILDSYTEDSGEKAKLLIDSYLIGYWYTRKLKKSAKIIVIDDLFENIYDADMIVNYSLYSNKFDYEKCYKNGARLCLGGAYIPLRSEFWNLSLQPTLKDVKNILLVCGGGDVLNSLAKILINISQRPRCHNYVYHVVVGAYNPHKEELQRLGSMFSWIKLYENITNMAELMCACDMAVSAASTVLYECCATGLPTIFYLVADNQRYDKDCFTQDQMMLYAGDMKSDEKRTLKNICNDIEFLANNIEIRNKMKQKMKTIIDGKGAQRIAEAIISL